ncbi:Hypothetical protein I595_2548 [Croceitalea dokdonensis DOKDO 023]|uniref:Uncharacterized protein n=1 Tax=Croceitalea dokdonensis DOKDO 023 TaxID=1300341 RepID=A0A0P7AHF6_9FLAO|nr:Hypothetical protein I595_2548 [Croceitalea dokdonensis DOKDO 023]
MGYSFIEPEKNQRRECPWRILFLPNVSRVGFAKFPLWERPLIRL